VKTLDSGRSSRVYLTGFMGSGKSTIGPILANTLGYDFVDIDKMIEQQTGESVKEIFDRHGEEYFRSLERDLLRSFQSRDHVVVSLGGGTIADPVSFPLIRRSGILVYLKTSPEHLIRRLHNKNDRPIISDVSGQNLNEEELRKRVFELYGHREQFYEKADIIVPTDEHRVGVTVDQIVRLLMAHID
jgi:shikimate kinase